MPRRLFTLLAALSLLICLSLSALWMRTYHALDILDWTRYGDGLFHDTGLMTAQGKVVIVFQLGTPISTASDPNAAERSRRYMDAQKPNNLAWNSERSQDPIGNIPGRSRLGFRYVAITFPESGIGLATGQDVPLRRDLTIFAVPFWFLVLLCAILPIRWLLLARTRWLREKRLRLGLCPTCAYDLRASKDRCPECGTPIATSEIENQKSKIP